MPLVATRGAASAQGFGEFAQSAAPVYIEDVFSTWLYTGNGSTQTITNGIDTSKGCLTWIKQRTNNGFDVNNYLFDTSRGSNVLQSNATAAQINLSANFAFAPTGFSVTANTLNFNSSTNYASWTFREQPKFFDVVTYTGNGVAGRTIAHNLGSEPGCIIIKCIDAGLGWVVGHRGVGWGNSAALQSADPFGPNSSTFNSTSPTSTVFTVGNASGTNSNGNTFVAYLFAHNAGGFGLSGTDNVISCGSYTGNGVNGVGGTAVNLGFEPQFLLVKCASNSDTYTDWSIFDNMRGCGAQGSPSNILYANRSFQENYYATESIVNFTATGFQLNYSSSSANFAFNQSGATYIYIAIRRGPMRTPTTGTSVFSPNLQTGGGTVTTNFPVDLIISTTPSQSGSYRTVNDRLRGGSTTRAVDLYTNVTDAETTGTGYGFGFDNNTGYRDAYYSNSFSDIYWNFRRAPGFFDEICFNSATAPTSALPHNLGVTPELVIYKSRTGSSNWIVFSSTSFSQYLMLNSNAASAGGITWSATSTTVDLSAVTGSRQDVAYLFASCPGVSKVGSYTGTGATQVINCGFTGGARFVLIKATSTTGDWYVWDSARGIVPANDPYLRLNSTAAEVTNTDWVDTAASGFELSNAAGNLANSNGVSYIFLAIA